MSAAGGRSAGSPRAREIRVAFALAALLAVGMVFVAVVGYDGTNDFNQSALASLEHLQRFEIGAFLDGSSIEAGSYILRAPLVFVPKLWGGGGQSLFAIMTVPAVLALIVLAVALWRYSLLRGARPGAALVVLLLVAANPFAFTALVPGHSEEVVGAALCVGAIVAAGRGRAIVAAALVGLAIANKAWGVLAVAPVLLMLRERRLLAFAVMAAIPALVYLPVVFRGMAGVDGLLVAAQTESIFRPWQVWWFFADPDQVHTEVFESAAFEYRNAPDWVVHINHPLAVLVPTLICLALARRMRERPWQDMMLLLSLMLLLRCMLDVANNAYYHLPFVFALLTWEVLARSGLPRRTLAVTLVGYPMLVLLPYASSSDAQAAVYLATSVPLAVTMVFWLVQSTPDAREPLFAITDGAPRQNVRPDVDARTQRSTTP